MTPVDNLANLTSDHFTNQQFRRYIRDGMRCDQSPITKHADPIGDSFQLFQSMGNVDDADTLIFQSINLRKEQIRFSIAERRSRLVKDQQLTAPRQSRRNLYQLPLPNTKGRSHHIRIQSTQTNKM